MGREHNYELKIKWTGNRGTGTSSYKDYDRSHVVSIKGKPDLPASADTAFLGDASKVNPEDMLIASIASCHMLWFLHLCADAGIIVISYSDNPTGILTQNNDGGGQFKSVTLNPEVTITEESKISRAIELHEEANKKCFISNSCNFPIHHNPKCKID